jgi:hypothetical protein
VSKLPNCVANDDFDLLRFDETNTARTNEVNLFDRNGYIDGDVPNGGFVSAGHASVYISGKLSEKAVLFGRKAVFCARSTVASARISGKLLIVGDKTTKETAAAVSMCDVDAPAVMIVPESQRAAVFDFLIGKAIREASTNEAGIPIQPLLQLAKRFPRMPIDFFNKGSEIDFRAMVAANQQYALGRQ